MRALIQRVRHASVVVEGKEIGAIDAGLLVLVGITDSDTSKDIEWIVKKILQLRVFKDDQEKMNLSVQDIGGELLVVSQFTLFADCAKGNRPSYIRSSRPDFAIPMYEQFLAQLRQQFSGKIATGIFGADMKITLLNDGPVTLMLDSNIPNL